MFQYANVSICAKKDLTIIINITVLFGENI